MSVAVAQNGAVEEPVIQEGDVPLQGADMTDEGVNYEDTYEENEPTYYNQQEVFGLNKEKTPTRPMDRSRWSKATEGMDFSNDRPVPVKPQRDSPSYKGPDWNPDLEGWKNFFKVFSLLVLLGLVAWLVYTFLQVPANTTIKAEDGTTITLDNLDAYIQETDLQRFLRLALENNDYNQAVRIYYLQIIKALSKKGAIEWSREKTNRDYLREMRSDPNYAEFRSNTRTYESVWYGNGILDKALFDRIEARMQQFLKGI